ncbi:MAG: DUF4373 domain-containing protein [bacterium]|nr:DUF4373 domain-containing protein [Parabacteroides sp.]MDD6080284.1 DUF4373 domain-containing protein [bacterium]
MSKKTSKKIVWIKLPVNLMDDARIAELVAKKRIGGFGVYIAILMELYRRPCRCLTLTQAKAIKVHGASPTTVKAVVNDSNLFRIDQKGVVRSAIDFLEFEEESESFTETQKGETKIDFELPTARPRVYIDKDRDKELLLKAAGEESTPDLLSQLRPDDPWAESVMMRSGFSGLLLRNWEEAIRQFRLHVVANDNLRGIHSLREAKQYFSSFTTHPVTGPALRKALEAYEASHPERNPYRFEDKGSCPGHRLYHGIALPDYAPPRPDERADWDFAEQCWIVI